jgi:hypothetical protein
MTSRELGELAGRIQLARMSGSGGVRSMATVRRPTSPLDTYHFEVASAATHIMTPEGPSDTVLTSHGSADPGRPGMGRRLRQRRQRPHRAKAAARRVLAVHAP